MAKAPNQEAISIPYRFSPRPYQIEVMRAMDNGCKRIFMRWSRRAGKDKTSFNIMVKAAIEHVGIYYYFFPTFAQGRKAVWEAIQDGEKLLDHIPECMIKSKNGNEMRIELVNNSIIRIIGTDNYDSIMGTNPIGVVFSEYSLQDPTAWDYIQPILMQNGGWALFNGTPRGKNHMYDMESSALKDPEHWHVSVVQSLYADQSNYYEVVTQEDIQQARSGGMTEETIASEFGVSYTASVEGTFYADCIEKARIDGRIDQFMPDSHKWVQTFWDLGLNDDTVIWFRQQYGNKLVFIDYYEDRGHDLAYYVQVLQDKGYKYSCHWLPHDGAHRNMQTTVSNQAFLQRLCAEAGVCDRVEVAAKVNNKQIAINAVRSRFSRYHFNEKLTADGVLKLSLYHRKYNQSSRTFMDTPHHDWCLTGDTKVRTLSGWKPIIEVTVNDMVWGYSEKERRLIPTKVTFSGKTAINAELVKVGLDNGKFIRCTLNHRFMNRHGGYTEARDLTIGQSLMPFYESPNNKYIRVELNDGSFGYEHALVFSRMATYIGGELHIDHIDGNKYNNEFSNLQGLTHQEHCSKTFKGLDSVERKAIDKTDYTREFYNRKNLIKMCSWCGDSFNGSHKESYCSKDCKLAKGRNREYSIEQKEEKNRKAREKYSMVHNHKVVSIEMLTEREDVYDLTVPETGNFVAEGVVVHNCSHSADALSTEALAGEFGEDGGLTSGSLDIITDFNPMDH